MFAWFKKLIAGEPEVAAPLQARDYPPSLYTGYWELHDNSDGTTQVRIYNNDALVVEKLMKPSEVAAFLKPRMEATRRE